jgi:uncharacterized protein (DUF1330 family)
MPAYLVVNIDVQDPERYALYRAMVPATLALFGGRYLARGGHTEVLEGDWHPERLVIVEFPSVERARAWLESPEYAGARAIRRATTHTDMVVIEGIADGAGGAS